MDYDTMESLKTISISLQNGQIIQLTDIATVTQAQKEAAYLSSYDGEETINIGIAKQQSATAQQVSEAVHNLLESMEQTMDPGVSIEITSDSYESIQSSLDSVMSTLILAILISMAILFLIFRRFAGIVDCGQLYAGVGAGGVYYDAVCRLYAEHYFYGQFGYRRRDDGRQLHSCSG